MNPRIKEMVKEAGLSGDKAEDAVDYAERLLDTYEVEQDWTRARVLVRAPHGARVCEVGVLAAKGAV
jgi:endonuclease III